jgi:hypothetical protein
MAKFTLSGNNLREGSAGSTVATVQGNSIREGSAGSTVATVDDVKKAIQGATGKMTDVALWWFFVRNR